MKRQQSIRIVTVLLLASVAFASCRGQGRRARRQARATDYGAMAQPSGYVNTVYRPRVDPEWQDFRTPVYLGEFAPERRAPDEAEEWRAGNDQIRQKIRESELERRAREQTLLELQEQVQERQTELERLQYETGL